MSDQVFIKNSPEEKQHLARHMPSERRDRVYELEMELKNSPGTLEGKGYETWLKRLGPQTFTKPFAFFHNELWDWYWAVTEKRRRGERLDIEDLVALYMLGRENGKSSHVEWACIAEGAMLGAGYVMYVCASEDQAKDHVAAIRDRLESSLIAQYYPGLANPEIGKHGFRKGWSQEYLATKSGWGIIPVGLDEGVRGGRKGDLRFTMIVLDDIDDFKDSPALVEKKLNTIVRSILPAGTEDTIVLFPQNLIHENSVMNQIYTRRSDALSVRKEFGPYPSFSELELELKDKDNGRVWDIKSCEPLWEALDILSARKYLSKFGRVAFLAEYQHDFEAAREGRVLRNWNDSLMVIKESDFARVFGSVRALEQFNKYTGHDWSRTKNEYHANVCGTLSVSSQNTPLPGKLFLHDLLSFEAGTQADDVGLRMLETISPCVPDILTTKRANKLVFTKQTWRELIDASYSRDGLDHFISDTTKLIEARRNILAGLIPRFTSVLIEQLKYKRFTGSHDQNNDALEVYRRVYGLPFSPVNPGETGGLEWADHYMTVDKTTKHPFFVDELLEDGTWKLGCPGFFLIVKDNKYEYPRGAASVHLHDSDLCRFQFNHWRMRPTRLSEAGAIEHGPMKMHDDFGQMLQMILYKNLIVAAALTRRELVHEHIKPELRYENLLKDSPFENGLTPEQELAAFLARQEAEKKVKPRRQKFDEHYQRIN